VLAATEAARHSNGAALGIGRDDRVHPIDPARAAVIFDGVTGAVRSGAGTTLILTKIPARRGRRPSAAVPMLVQSEFPVVAMNPAQVTIRRDADNDVRQRQCSSRSTTGRGRR
jgi:hypothetical protein